MRSNGRPDGSRFRAETTDDGAALYLYSPVGYWGVTAQEFLDSLLELGSVPRIHLYIHSPGGEVFDGFAIFAQLLRHPAEIIVHVDGLAGSIASVIAMSGDEIEIASVGFLYVHRPWSLCIGYADDMEQEAKLLRQIEPSIASAYRPRYTGSAAELAEVMDGDGTWFSASDALEVGLVDRVVEAKPPAAQQDLSAFAKVPPVVQEMWGHAEGDKQRARLPHLDRGKRTARLELVRQAVATLGGTQTPAGAEARRVAASVSGSIDEVLRSIGGARTALATTVNTRAVLAGVEAARRRIALARSRAEGGTEL